MSVNSQIMARSNFPTQRASRLLRFFQTPLKEPEPFWEDCCRSTQVGLMCKLPAGLPPQPQRGTPMHAEHRSSAQTALADEWFHEEPTMASPSSLTDLVTKADAAAQPVQPETPSFIN